MPRVALTAYEQRQSAVIRAAARSMGNEGRHVWHRHAPDVDPCDLEALADFVWNRNFETTNLDVQAVVTIALVRIIDIEHDLDRQYIEAERHDHPERSAVPSNRHDTTERQRQGDASSKALDQLLRDTWGLDIADPVVREAKRDETRSALKVDREDRAARLQARAPVVAALGAFEPTVAPGSMFSSLIPVVPVLRQPIGDVRELVIALALHALDTKPKGVDVSSDSSVAAHVCSVLCADPAPEWLKGWRRRFSYPTVLSISRVRVMVAEARRVTAIGFSYNDPICFGKTFYASRGSMLKARAKRLG